MAKGPPKAVALDHDAYAAKYVGRTRYDKLTSSCSPC
jgi:hypothetical protein